MATAHPLTTAVMEVMEVMAKDMVLATSPPLMDTVVDTAAAMGTVATDMMITATEKLYIPDHTTAVMDMATVVMGAMVKDTAMATPKLTNITALLPLLKLFTITTTIRLM